MPLPRWLARVNRRLLNPREIARGERPVLTHVGRTSGATYRTPLDARPVDGGFVVDLRYGSRSDWVRNVLAAGSARWTDGATTSSAPGSWVPAAPNSCASTPRGRRRSPRCDHEDAPLARRRPRRRHHRRRGGCPDGVQLTLFTELDPPSD